ncbi:flagellar motor switch protein FliN [Desulfoplanes sp.]
MTDQDNQDKLAEEWAAALEQDGGGEETGGGQDEDALAAQWAAALSEDQGGPDKGSGEDALADEWAAALAQDEHEQITKEQNQGVEARQGREYEFKNLTAEAKAGQGEKTKRDLDFILDIPLTVSAQLGSTQLLINELLQLGQGSVIELNKLAGEPLEIMVNGKLVARGEAVVINEKFGVRLTDIISPIERVKQLA